MHENATIRKPRGACGEKASANVALGPATFRFGLQSTLGINAALPKHGHLVVLLRRI